MPGTVCTWIEALCMQKGMMSSVADGRGHLNSCPEGDGVDGSL